MSDTHKPESLESLWKQAFPPIENAYKSGFMVGVEQGVDITLERLMELFINERCKCMDLEGEELSAFIKAEAKYHHPLKHANCAIVDLDWVIEQISEMRNKGKNEPFGNSDELGEK